MQRAVVFENTYIKFGINSSSNGNGSRGAREHMGVGKQPMMQRVSEALPDSLLRFAAVNVNHNQITAVFNWTQLAFHYWRERILLPLVLCYYSLFVPNIKEKKKNKIKKELSASTMPVLTALYMYMTWHFIYSVLPVNCVSFHHCGATYHLTIAYFGFFFFFNLFFSPIL